MCGRYGRRGDKQRIAEMMQTRNIRVFDQDFAPTYNAAPQSMQPVVRLDRESGERELTGMRWGLIPYWAKNEKVGYSTINARAETLTSSAAFREAVKRRRCLIPADVFYEWKTIDKKNKQPYAIAVTGVEMFAFAGLWERWKDRAPGREERVIESFTIITTDPNELMEPFHDRMPAILRPEDYERWLQPGDPERLPTDLLRPYPEKAMRAWKVSKRVGNTRNDDPSLVEEVNDADADPGEIRKEPVQGRLDLG